MKKVGLLLAALSLFVFTGCDFKKQEKPEEPKEPETKVCPYCLTDVKYHATRCPHCTSVLEDEVA